MLEVKQLKLSHDQQRLLGPLNFRIAAGEIMGLMGPSGSGKSTLLNWLIGALPAAFTAEGELRLNGQDLIPLSIEQRRIGILFQDDLLFPHLSVGDNLMFALPATQKPKKQRRQTIESALQKADLSGFFQRDPATLSGGQRARVSLLRTLLAQPKAILLDEPFSRLDQSLRGNFRHFVYQQIQQQNIPALLVTHDPADLDGTSTTLHLEQHYA